jgi:hypothetical protein
MRQTTGKKFTAGPHPAKGELDLPLFNGKMQVNTMTGS